MPINSINQTADVLAKVETLLTRFESVRVQTNTQDVSSLQEIQKLATRIDRQFSQINAVLDTINRFDRGGSDIAFTDNLTPQSNNTIRRSQDEWAHLFSRLVIGGANNF